MPMALKTSAYEAFSPGLLHLGTIADAPVWQDPYPHVSVDSALPRSHAHELEHDFPPICRTGFFPLQEQWRQGAFARLIDDFESPEFTEIMTAKLGIELGDKPRMITIRKWSAARDGRIHNDSESKIATALLYLNPAWRADAGRLRVLRSKTDFEQSQREISPEFGSFFAFRRTENSWHGHKPFVGERRVIQVTWLRSWEDYYRKEKRGKLSWILKSFRKDY